MAWMRTDERNDTLKIDGGQVLINSSWMDLLALRDRLLAREQ